jgi:CheY-specific phosphatase CheX
MSVASEGAPMIASPILSAGQEAAVREVVADACVDMLTACGMPVGNVSAGRLIALSEHDIAGFIGFTGRVRGSLIVAASSKVFGSTFPSSAALSAGAKPSLPDLLDWAGEMANQTLGRIKRRFCDRGMDFETSTPTAINGRHIGGRSPVRDGIVDMVLTAGDELISVCFEVVPPANGNIFTIPADPIPCSQEGDLVLF